MPFPVSFLFQQLSETVTVLKAQNDELVGHNNTKQKIHLHQTIKEENHKLQDKIKVCTLGGR